jgi:hypothetical protein
MADFDDPIPQCQLTSTRKMENQGTPESSTGSHSQHKAEHSKSINTESTNYVKNGKNYLKLNTPNLLPLKVLCWSSLHNLVFHGKSCFPAHTGTRTSMLPPTSLPATFILKHQGKWCPWLSRTQSSHWSTSNRRHKPAGLVPSGLQHHGSVLLEDHPGK